MKIFQIKTALILLIGLVSLLAMLACAQINRIFCPEPEAEISMGNSSLAKKEGKEVSPKDRHLSDKNQKGRKSEEKNPQSEKRDPASQKTVSPSQKKEERKALTRDEKVWIKDPEVAFKELEKFSGKAEAAWHFIQKYQPHRIPEIRERVLNKYPFNVNHDSELCISMLKTLQKLGLPLTKNEQGFLRFNKNRELAIKLAWEEENLRKKDKDAWMKRYRPEYYKWSKDPESAFRLLETWPQSNAQNPLHFIECNYPQRIGELRARMLDKMPSKFWGNGIHQMILYALHEQKQYISEKEKQLLIDNNYIPDPNDPRDEVRKDKTGNLALLEIAKFSKYSDECISYFTGSSYFLWRIADLRQIADNIPSKHYGSQIHLEIIYNLLSYGEPVSEKEIDLLKKKKYRGPLPKEDWIKYLTEVKLKAIQERQGK